MKVPLCSNQFAGCMYDKPGNVHCTHVASTLLWQLVKHADTADTLCTATAALLVTSIFLLVSQD
jgi:hypothetical protein